MPEQQPDAQPEENSEDANAGRGGDQQRRVTRWRLVLGEEADEALGCPLDGPGRQRDRALDFLYRREYGARRNVRGPGCGGQKGSPGTAGLGDSQLTVPDWINQVQELFPQKTIERLERDALQRYQLEEMVTNPEVLKRAQPNQALLRAVLQTKHLMNQEVLAAARKLVEAVVRELMEKLARQVRQAFSGSIDRRRRSSHRVAKNFDASTTIRRNLVNYDQQRKQIVIKQPYFFSRVRRHCDRWQLIILVDQSGSMAGSVIHASVSAAIFFGLSTLRTHLCLFDTNVVDVTSECTDPVETLMRVQLGGGTDIGHALTYASTLVENPRRTIVVVISDFFEGGSESRLLNVARSLIESGVNLLGLAALDETCQPNYDHRMASRLVELGAHVAAMTPDQLAAWVAEKIR